MDMKTMRRNGNVKFENDVCSAFNDSCAMVGVRAAELSIVDPDYGEVAVRFGEASTGDSFLVNVACIIKPITATLIMQLVSTGNLSINDSASDLLSDEAPNSRLLDGVKISHLLTHTHGLSCYSLPIAPVKGRCIDVASIFRADPHNARLFVPGKFYSYDNCGYYLLGAVLERILGAPFRSIVEKYLIDKLAQAGIIGDRDWLIYADTVCPASGHGLQVTANFLSGFAKEFIDTGQTKVLGMSTSVANSMLSEVVSFPGLSIMFSGAGLGFKYIRQGWSGHYAVSKGSHALIKINADRAVGFVLTASDSNDSQSVLGLGGLIIRRVYPELFKQRYYRVERNDDVVLDDVVGIYGSEQSYVRLSLRNDRMLKLEFIAKEHSEEFVLHSCDATPAMEHYFMMTSPFRDIICLRLLRDDTQKWLWDGNRIWPAITNRAATLV